MIDQAMAWHHSQEIRAYLAAIRKAANDRHGAIEAGSELDEWLRWAETVANSMDPLALSPRGEA